MISYQDFYDISTKDDKDFVTLINQHNWPFGRLDDIPCSQGKFKDITVAGLLLLLFKRAKSQSQASQDSTVIEVVILFNLIKNKIF
jgi:hypothetical protein